MISVTKFVRKNGGRRKKRKGKWGNVANILNGNRYEPIIRECYGKIRGVNITLCSKNMTYNNIVGKCDGLIEGGEGIIEIKWTRSLSRGINTYIRKLSENKIPGLSYTRHIRKSHYLQIQIYLRMYDRLWCDYIVYSQYQKIIFIYRCYRDDINFRKANGHYCLVQIICDGNILYQLNVKTIKGRVEYYHPILVTSG